MHRSVLRELIYVVGLLAAFASLIFLPEITSGGVVSGLRMCAGAILPALFPFFVCTNLMGRLGLSRKLSALLAPLTKQLFGCEAAAAPFVFGLLGGYPAGAKAIADLYRTKQLEERTAKRLLRFCNNSGPAFIFGVVGSRVFHSGKVGLFLYGIQILSAVVCGLLSRESSGAAPTTADEKPLTFPAAFTESVRDAGNTALQVCMFVTIFSVFSALLRFFLEPLLPPALLPFATGILELSCGTQALADSCLPFRLQLVLSSFLLAFGGISIHAQTKALLLDAGLPDAPVLLPKLLQSCIAALLTVLFLHPAGIVCVIGSISLCFLKLISGNLRANRV